MDHHADEFIWPSFMYLEHGVGHGWAVATPSRSEFFAKDQTSGSGGQGGGRSQHKAGGKQVMGFHISFLSGGRPTVAKSQLAGLSPSQWCVSVMDSVDGIPCCSIAEV